MKRQNKFKKLLILMLTLSIILPTVLIPTSSFAAANAFTYIEATTLDKENSIAGQGSLQFYGNRIGSIWPQGYLVYKNIDFGKTAPLTVEATAGARAGHAELIKIMIDSPKSDPIALVPITQIEFAVPETNSAEMLQKVTGVHDVYITTAASTMNFYGFQFFGKPEEKAVYREYTGESNYADITDEQFKRDIGLLEQLGMISLKESVFDENMPVTRGEFASAVYAIYKDVNSTEDDGSIVESAKFSDVNAENPNAVAIGYLGGVGVMNGTTEDTFSPNEFITEIDAATVLVRVLGYRKIAEEAGGYPNGYTATAVRERIVKGTVRDEMLNRGNMVSLLKNAIEADCIVPNGVYNEYTTYDTLDSILCDTQNIYRGEGIVAANSFSSLNLPDTDLGTNEVLINNEAYKVGKTAAGGFLGIDAEFYYQVKDGVKTIKAIIPADKTEIIDISSKEYEISSLDNKGITYYEKGSEKEEETEFKSSARVIYNGVAAEKPLEDMIDDIDNFIGKIRVVENGDGSQNIIIEEYDDYVIASVASDFTSFKAAHSGDAISWSASDNVFAQNALGEAVEFKKLDVGDVVTVYESKNEDGKKLIRMFVADSNESGTITKEEDGEIYLNDVWREVSHNYIPMKSEERPTIGQNSIYYFNIYGDIVKAATNDPTLWQTGLFMGYSATDTGFGKDAQIKIMTMDAKAVIYDTADKVTADGVKVSDKSVLINGAENGFRGLADIDSEEVVRYRINTENQLFALDTAETIGEGGHDDLLKCLSNTADKFMYVASSQMLFNKVSNKFLFYANKSTAKVFAFYGAQTRDDRDTACSVLPAEKVLDSTNYEFAGGIYSTKGSEKEADVLVWTNYTSRLSLNSHFVYESSSEGLNDDGDAITLIHGWYNGGLVTYKLDLTCKYEVDTDAVAATSIVYSVEKLKYAKPGDVFRLKVYPDGTIQRAVTYFLQGGASTREGVDNPTDDSLKEKNNDDTKYIASFKRPECSPEANSLHTKGIFGKVTDKTDNYITVEVDDGTEKIQEVAPLTGNVCLVDTSEAAGKYFVEKAVRDNVSVGDYVYVYYSGGQVQTIIIYKDIVR